MAEDHRYKPTAASLQQDANGIPDETGLLGQVASVRQSQNITAELSRVIDKAMAQFDSLPGCAVRGGGGLRGAAARDVAKQSSNISLFQVLGLLALVGALRLAQGSLEVLGAIGALVVAGCAVFIWYCLRYRPWHRIDNSRPMDPRLRSVQDLVIRFRASLPRAHDLLGESIEAVEGRMIRVFARGDTTISSALVRQIAVAFDHDGFDRLALQVSAVSAPLAELRAALARAVAMPLEQGEVRLPL